MAVGALSMSSPFTASQPENRPLFLFGAGIGDGRGQAGGKGAGDPREAGKVLEKVLHNGGYGGVVLCRPDARLAVSIVADGYGDVAHGFSFGFVDWAGFWLLI